MSLPGAAARYRGLRTTEAEHEWVMSCLSGNGYPSEVLAAKVEHRMAQHAARVAWAEVEYAARSAGNCVGMIHTSIRATVMRDLVAAAYAAERVEHDAAVAMRTAEHRWESGRFREATPWPT